MVSPRLSIHLLWVPLNLTFGRPLWISPRQVIVIPIAHAYDHFAQKVANRFHDAGFYVEADTGGDTLMKKILNAQVAQWNYILGKAPSPPCFVPR